MMTTDKPLLGAVVFVDSDAFIDGDNSPEAKKLKDAGAVVVFVKPGSRAHAIWPPSELPFQEVK